jgi:hypothetical protein
VPPNESNDALEKDALSEEDPKEKMDEAKRATG